MDLTDKVVLSVITFLGVVVAAIVIVAIVSDSEGCPEGTHSEFSHHIPIKSGKVTVMSPVYECERD